MCWGLGELTGEVAVAVVFSKKELEEARAWSKHCIICGVYWTRCNLFCVGST